MDNPNSEIVLPDSSQKSEDFNSPENKNCDNGADDASSLKLDEDESPPFEPLEETKNIQPITNIGTSFLDSQLEFSTTFSKKEENKMDVEMKDSVVKEKNEILRKSSKRRVKDEQHKKHISKDRDINISTEKNKTSQHKRRTEKEKDKELKGKVDKDITKMEKKNKNLGQKEEREHESTLKRDIGHVKKMTETVRTDRSIVDSSIDVQKIVKPKCASNIEDARNVMKIRKQLTELEKQNILGLTQIDFKENGTHTKKFKQVEEKEIVNRDEDSEKKRSSASTDILLPKSNTETLESINLSQEKWEALEARLAQEMARVDDSSYESHYDDYDDIEQPEFVSSSKKQNKSKDNQDGIEHDDACRYLEKSYDHQKRLEILFKYIDKLEKRILQNVKIIQKNSLTTKKGIKRKLQEHVDISTRPQLQHRVVEVKRGRERSKTSIAGSSPRKQKSSSVIGTPKQQSYSSSDLYKPRTNLRIRRTRAPKNT